MIMKFKWNINGLIYMKKGFYIEVKYKHIQNQRKKLHGDDDDDYKIGPLKLLLSSHSKHTATSSTSSKFQSC